MPDFITNIARFAVEAHERGEITKDNLIEVLQACVNARAEENGYADEFGLPFPNLCALTNEHDDQPIPDEPDHPAMMCSYDEDDTGADHAGGCGCLALAPGGWIVTYPANPNRAPLHPIVVTFDGCSDTFRGYTDGRAWNGYQCPHFEHEEAGRVLAFLRLHGEDVWLAGPTAIESRPGEIDRGFAYATRQITTNGPRVLFDFGGMGWCFVEGPTDDADTSPALANGGAS